MPLRVLFFELGLGKTKQVSVRILDQDFLLHIGYTIAFVTANIMYQGGCLKTKEKAPILLQKKTGHKGPVYC